jgi:hypothetical protein
MRFMTIYRPGYESTTPPTQEEMAAMGKLIEDLAKSGMLIATDGLQHSSKGARVKLNEDGSFTVIDGPFTEAKEIIGGFAIINASSKEEIIELTKKFLRVAGGGESEIRLMHDQPAFDSQSNARSANAAPRQQESTAR